MTVIVGVDAGTAVRRLERDAARMGRLGYPGAARELRAAARSIRRANGLSANRRDRRGW